MVRPTSRDQHLAVGEQCRSVKQPTVIEAACDRPISRARIVDFRACESWEWKGPRAWSRTACDQHPPIKEQGRRLRRRVISPGMIHTAAELPLEGSSDARLRECRT